MGTSGRGTVIRARAAAGAGAGLGQDLATALVEARGERPRRELAAAAGVHGNTLGDLERCRANPTLAYIEAIGAVYGIRFRLVAEPIVAE